MRTFLLLAPLVALAALAGCKDEAPAPAADPAAGEQFPPAMMKAMAAQEGGQAAEGKFPPAMMEAIAKARAAEGGKADPGDAQMVAQHQALTGGPAETTTVKVEKAGGPAGKTVAEVWANRGSLAGQEVAIRGQVVKYNAGIMGKNWLHLRDGTGSRAAKDDDLTVTTAGTAAVGEVITIRGKVAVDRDFGAGYSYPVIVEDAAIEK